MTESHRSFTVCGSSAQKAFALSVHRCPWLTLNQHLDQYLVDISIGSWSLVGRVLTDRYLSINTQCHVCGNLSTLDRLLTECQPSINGDVDWNINQGYQLTSNSDALSTHDPTALLVSGSVCILFLNTSIRDCRKIMWVRTLVLSTESEWLPQ